MSGPWDRRPDDPDDRRDAASPNDQAQDSAPGWDAWASPAPPPDDVYLDDPPMPSSDPWAESWTDDDAPGQLAPAESAESEPSVEPPAPFEPRPDPEWEPDAVAPESQGRIEPWAPEPDPWGESVDAPVTRDSPFARTGTDELPDWLAEPDPEPARAVEPEPEREPEPEPEPERAATPEPLGDPWGRGNDSTQVLPRSWAPPSPTVAPASDVLVPSSAPIRTAIDEGEIEVDETLDERPSTSEQAVPWLIGVILLLAGMVIVLLALIFAGPESLGGIEASPSASAVAGFPSASAQPRATVGPSTRPTVSASVAPTVEPTATPVPLPAYGPLEMVYQGRATALAPIYLLRRDFTIEEDANVMAQDPSLDVRRFAWAPDGTAGAGLLADVLVSIEPGDEKRRLGDGITTITFGADASTVYAVRVTQDGDNDVATVLSIDFTSADTTELASVTFLRPALSAQEAIAEAQFSDDGGPMRLYFMESGVLRLWALDAGTWDIDLDDGEVTEIDEALPRLWAPDGTRRVGAGSEEGMTTLTLVDEDGETLAETTIEARVSHLRWSPDGERLVFTAGRSASAGGVLQDLYLWDLVDGEAPMQLTPTGAAFGAEWLGSQPLWRDE